MLMKSLSSLALAAIVSIGMSPAIASAQNDGKKKDKQKQAQADTGKSKQSDDARSAGSKMASDQMTGGGTVQRTKKVRIPGTTIENLVVLVKMKKPGSDKTTTRIVDLGPIKDLKSIRVRQGDNIKVSGRVVGMKDKQVLMADEVSAHDMTQKIKRQKPKSKSDKPKKTDKS